MSQAHYQGCTWGAVWALHVPTAAVAEVTWERSHVTWDLCRDCLNDQLDKADDGIVFEPSKIEWVYDAGIPHCGIHHWPAELCEGWSHRPLIERLRATYADGRPSTRSDDPT